MKGPETAIDFRLLPAAARDTPAASNISLLLPLASQFPAMRRAQSFFSHAISNTRFFKSASANISFNSVFSRSISLSFRASLMSFCLNCRFHWF